MKKYIQILVLLTFTIQGYSQEYNRWFIKKSNGNFGFIDSLGNEIFSGKFDFLGEHYHSGLVEFKKKSKNGYLDVYGKIAFTTNNYCDNFSENLLPVENKGEFYYLNTKGQKELDLSKLIISNGKKVYRICNFYSGLALVILDDNCPNNNLLYNNLIYGYIDKTGQWCIEPIFQHATSFVEGVAYVVKDNKGYFMDTEGNFLAQLNDKSGEIWQEEDSDLFNFSEGFATVYFPDSVSLGFSTSFINKKGERIGSRMFRRANNFSDGMAAIQLELDEKWGFIDTTGNIVIQPQYYIRSDFSEGLAPVSLEVEEMGYMFNSYFIQGFIDKTGATVIPFQPHVSYKGFKNGLTKGERSIYKNKRYTGKYELFYMNKQGEIIWSEVVKQ